MASTIYGFGRDQLDIRDQCRLGSQVSKSISHLRGDILSQQESTAQPIKALAIHHFPYDGGKEPSRHGFEPLYWVIYPEVWGSIPLLTVEG